MSSASSPARSTATAPKLAGKIAEVGKLQAVMACYRDKLANGGLSAIN